MHCSMPAASNPAGASAPNVYTEPCEHRAKVVEDDSRKNFVFQDVWCKPPQEFVVLPGQGQAQEQRSSPETHLEFLANISVIRPKGNQRLISLE